MKPTYSELIKAALEWADSYTIKTSEEIRAILVAGAKEIPANPTQVALAVLAEEVRALQESILVRDLFNSDDPKSIDRINEWKKDSERLEIMGRYDRIELDYTDTVDMRRLIDQFIQEHDE